MKIIFSVLSSLLFLTGVSQNSRDVFAGRTIPPVNSEKLKVVKCITDVIPNCPQHWNEIIDITSITILAVCDGEAKMAESTDDKITHEQNNILSSADMGTEISINIKYRWKDATSVNAENGTILKMNEFRVAVVPEKEAQFPGGTEQLKDYLSKNISGKLPKPSKEKPFIPGASAVFTVDENGEVSDVKITKPSKDTEIDQLLLDAISKMPKWKPAENSKGEKVKQKFKYGFNSGKFNNNGC